MLVLVGFLPFSDGKNFIRFSCSFKCSTDKITFRSKFQIHTSSSLHLLVDFFKLFGVHNLLKKTWLMVNKLIAGSFSSLEAQRKYQNKLGVTPNLSAFKEIVKVNFRTVKYIALKINTEFNFQARWLPYIKFISETYQL